MFCRWKRTDNNDIIIFLSLENPCAFLLAKEKTWKCIFNTNIELSQIRTKQQQQQQQKYHPEQQKIVYLIIYDVINSLLVLIEKLAIFNKQL